MLILYLTFIFLQYELSIFHLYFSVCYSFPVLFFFLSMKAMPFLLLEACIVRTSTWILKIMAFALFSFHSFCSILFSVSSTASSRISSPQSAIQFSFNFHYPLVSLKWSNSCFHLLPRLSVTGFLSSIFPSVTNFRRQFLRQMWAIELVFLFMYCT